MGLTYSKENPSVRDRVRFCDDLWWFHESKVAAAGAGRYAMILSRKKEKYEPEETIITTFELDYVDLLLCTRVRLLVGEFFNFGEVAGFYALDERTVVIIDVDGKQDTLRQRMIALDPDRNTTHAFLDRGYDVDTRNHYAFLLRSAVSEDRVISTMTVFSLERGDAHLAIVYPKNPLDCQMTVEDISGVMREASFRLQEEANSAEYNFSISQSEPPFFLSSTKVGFFTHRTDVQEWQRLMAGHLIASVEFFHKVDHSYYVTYDWQDDEINVLRVQPDPVTNFPYRSRQEGSEQPFDCHSYTASSKQLGLAILDDHLDRGWRRRAVIGLTYVLGKIARSLLRATPSKILSRLPWRTYLKFFYYERKHRALLKTRKVRYGLLDTSTMRWKEQVELADEMDNDRFKDMRLAVFPDGHGLIFDQESDTKFASRNIGNSSEPSEEMRVLANPGRVFSLKTLAEMQVRKQPIARLAILQIAARIQ